MTYAHDLRVLLQEGHTPEAAAQSLVESLTPEELTGWVQALLADRARHIARHMTRDVEEEVEANLGRGADPVEARRLLVSQTFPGVDFASVPWLEATAEDHEWRAAWQRNSAAAATRDAERHERAASEIRTAGVSCLADLDPALAAELVPA